MAELTFVCKECLKDGQGDADKCGFVCGRCRGLTVHQIARRLLGFKGMRGGPENDFSVCNRCDASGRDITRMVHALARSVLGGGGSRG